MPEKEARRMSERTISYAEAVREALIESALRDPSVIFLAEGVADPSSIYGTTKGIAERCGAQRVIEMPIAENGLTGVAVGAALVGKRPVISFQRVEFALLAMEQLVNNAAKSRYISNGRHKVPLVVRMVIGRGWGQGPEHSQSLEAMFSHFPGLKVVMPAFPRDAKGLITGAIADDNPVVVIEHRWCHYATGSVPEGYYAEPLDGPQLVRDGSDVTIVATSYMTLEAVRAADALAAVGCSAAVVDLRVLRPLDPAVIFASVERTGRLMTVDTGWWRYGVGGEVVAEVASKRFATLRAAPVRLGLPEHPVPSSRALLPGVYPNAERIVREVGAMTGLPVERIEEAAHAIATARGSLPADIPDPFFKGPF
jgi:acetoin:2,6-dichlorophenolindophenol oxidoreductase subunit beta